MNGYMDSTPGRIDMLNWEIFQRSTDIPVPCDLFVMIDEREDSIQDGFFVVDMNEPKPLMYSAPRSAHNEGGVLGFADGHVIRKKWLDMASWPCVTLRGHCVGCCADHIDRLDGTPRDGCENTRRSGSKNRLYHLMWPTLRTINNECEAGGF